ncbi:MAG: hypothetical protein WA990_13925 [Rubrobacteraceae bacterium]
MRNIRWIGVILGAVTSIVLALVLLGFVGLVVDPLLGAVTGNAAVEGTTSLTVAQERLRGFLLGGAAILAVLFAFFIGGLVAGQFKLSYAGFNGAVTGIIVLAIPLIWLLVSIASVSGLVGSPGDVQGQSENLRMLFAALVVYAIASPVVVLMGFWGGRIARRLGEGLFEGVNGRSA